MAHECPDCGYTCHCNGDIDDLLLNDEDDIIHCDHCLDDIDNEEDDYDLDTDCGEVEPEGR